VKVRPLRNLVYVERIRPEATPGGILIPQTFDHKHSARLKTAATPDYFPARVLAVGPQVRDLKEDDHVFVWTYAEGDGSKLFTGDAEGALGKDRMFVAWPNDFVCAQDMVTG
jgi:co-chaperonin GroES (HSP10)